MNTKRKALNIISHKHGELYPCQLAKSEQDYLRDIVLQSLHHDSIATAMDTIDCWTTYNEDEILETLGRKLSSDIYDALNDIVDCIFCEKVKTIISCLYENYSYCY